MVSTIVIGESYTKQHPEKLGKLYPPINQGFETARKSTLVSHNSRLSTADRMAVMSLNVLLKIFPRLFTRQSDNVGGGHCSRY